MQTTTASEQEEPDVRGHLSMTSLLYNGMTHTSTKSMPKLLEACEARHQTDLEHARATLLYHPRFESSSVIRNLIDGLSAASARAGPGSQTRFTCKLIVPTDDLSGGVHTAFKVEHAQYTTRQLSSALTKLYPTVDERWTMNSNAAVLILWPSQHQVEYEDAESFNPAEDLTFCPMKALTLEDLLSIRH